jgi:hypothetical protein
MPNPRLDTPVTFLSLDALRAPWGGEALERLVNEMGARQVAPPPQQRSTLVKTARCPADFRE